MKLTLILVLGLTVTVNSYSQTVKNKTVKVENKETFDQFCLNNALTYITVSPDKAGVVFTGELKGLSKENPTYSDYGITLKENEAQYFSVEGKNTVIKVESLYRLRLAYNAKNK
jgi:hypothetical protein